MDSIYSDKFEGFCQLECLFFHEKFVVFDKFEVKNVVSAEQKHIGVHHENFNQSRHVLA